MVGGAVVGVIAAFAGYGIVFGFAYAFILGFADHASSLFEALRVDPQLTDVLRSPWLLVLMAEVVVVAPLTEEFGKAVGGRWSRPSSRQEAFLAGIAAGAGFAVVENVLYALGGAWAPGLWIDILLARLPGAAVHSLASGLVLLGWWGRRHGERRREGIRLILGGVGVHALWNGAWVATVMAEQAYGLGATGGVYRIVTLSYGAALGAIVAAVLWWMLGRVASDDTAVSGLGDGRFLAAWVAGCASLVVPIAMAVLVFPGFYLG
jgi:hypothetical protein